MDEQTPGALGDAEFAQLKQLIDSGDPRGKAIARQLGQADNVGLMEYIKKNDPNKVTSMGMVPGAGLVGKLATSALDALPAMPALGGAGSAIKSGIGGYLGWEGAQSVGKALGLPAPIRDIISLIAAHGAGSAGSKGKGPGTPDAAMSEEVALRKAGVGDAAINATKNGRSPMPWAGKTQTPTGGGPPGPPAGGPPNVFRVGSDQLETAELPSMQGGARTQETGRNGLPPNVSLRRTPADVQEQVGRGLDPKKSGSAELSPGFMDNGPIETRLPPRMAEEAYTTDPGEMDKLLGKIRDALGAKQGGPQLRRPNLPSENQGADMLGELMDALHGSNAKPKGNGLLK